MRSKPRDPSSAADDENHDGNIATDRLAGRWNAWATASGCVLRCRPVIEQDPLRFGDGLGGGGVIAFADGAAPVISTHALTSHTSGRRV